MLNICKIYCYAALLTKEENYPDSWNNLKSKISSQTPFQVHFIAVDFATWVP